MSYTIPQILAKSAQRHPEQVAFKCLSSYLTYGELERRSNSLATLLNEFGVNKGDRVGIFLNRSLEIPVSIYGIAAAGAVFVPLDITAPIERIQFLIRDCDIKYLITSPVQSKKLKAFLSSDHGLHGIIGLNTAPPVKSVTWPQVIKHQSNTAKLPKVLGSDLAYIMYTSGSTGIPKGIMHTHDSCLAYAKLSSELYGVSTDDIVAAHAPLHFDISTFAYFSAPLAGAATVIVTDAQTKFPASLFQLLVKEKITIWYSVPLAIIQLLDNGLRASAEATTLRWVLFGGEVFPNRYLREVMTSLPQTRFSNVYGPAEVNQCTYHHITQVPQPEEEIPLGKVWGNTSYKILNEEEQEVEKGALGMLAIRSATMMLGYWNQPELTKNSIHQDTSEPNCPYNYFKTGDLVYEREGLLYFKGRKDHQVKVRGYRVELGEIEAVLGRHPMVKEAAVVVYNAKAEESEIVSAVILINAFPNAQQDLLQYCQLHLPKYAVPQRFLLMNHFPRTTSDKIDREQIKDQIIALQHESNTY